MKNTYNVELSTTMRKERMVQTGLHIKSQDININEFRFRFKNDTGEELNLNAEFQVDVLSFFSRAGTKSLTTARVLGNFAFWEFDTALISGDDTVVNYVYVKKNGVPITSADANGFTFDVSLSKLDENTGRVAETYDKNYEKILHEFEVAINLTKDEWEQMADEARIFVDEIKDVTVDQFIETKMGEELANLEVNYATRLTGLEQKDNQLTAQLAQTEQELTTQLQKTTGELDRVKEGIGTFTTLKNYADNYFLGLSKSVPDYYVDRLNQIANLVNSEDDTVLRSIFLTDNHNQYSEYAHNSIYHMEYGAMLTNLCNIDLYVLGGDNANGWYNKPEITNELKSSVSVAYNLSNVNTDVFALNGNHDNGAFQNGKNKLNDIITNDELKHIMRTKHSVFNENREGDSLYFFKDYPQKKYRVFGLNTFDFPNETVEGELKWNNLTHSAYSEEQLRWFAKHLKETPEDYHVIIFQHAPLLNVFNDQTQYNGDVMKDILKAFKNGNSFSISDNVRPIPVNLSVDFEGRNGVIAVVVNGHLHEDLSTVWEGILCLSTEASLCYPQTETRKWDTYGEDSWDCMLFDHNTRTIKCLRFGHGENRLFSY